MFSSSYLSGRLAGVLVGARRSSVDAWRPAIDSVTVESVVVHGVSLAIGPWADLIVDGDIGWPLFGNARGGTFVVYVRNDAPELRELRVVVALHGDIERGHRRLRNFSDRKR
ncbi:MAG: hypothetical protein AB7O21_19630 [Gammaproteobacteria bacterium]